MEYKGYISDGIDLIQTGKVKLRRQRIISVCISDSDGKGIYTCLCTEFLYRFRFCKEIFYLICLVFCKSYTAELCLYRYASGMGLLYYCCRTSDILL